MKRDQRGFTLRELVAVVVIAAVLAALGVVAFRHISNSLLVDTDHNAIANAWTLARQAAASSSNPADGSALPDGGDPLVFYYSIYNRYDPEGSQYRPVPDNACTLGGTDGNRGRTCGVNGPGTIQPAKPDPSSLTAGSITYCGAHLKGNHIKLVYYPKSGGWVMVLEE